MKFYYYSRKEFEIKKFCQIIISTSVERIGDQTKRHINEKLKTKNSKSFLLCSNFI